ncbi:hypothetical protein FRC03_000668 [Tulasnella sp. 419]|nr:hypothetical protein FRC03_000668 [Tulasnella sp. 419]
MERELRRLGDSLGAGDLGFLGYSGHAIQFDTENVAIVPTNGSTRQDSLIMNDDLSQWLVAQLPPGATLLVSQQTSGSLPPLKFTVSDLKAAFDCCHSETLLKLPFKYDVEQDDQQQDANQQPTIKITRAGDKERGGHGFVLCLSASMHNQPAHEIRNTRTGEVFGAMTALLHQQFKSRNGSCGAGYSLSMAPPTVQDILVNLTTFFQEKGNSTMVQITSSKELPNPCFGGRSSSEVAAPNDNV